MRRLLPLLLLAIAAGCRLRPPAQERSFLILAVNDVYRIEGVDDGRVGGLARLRALRRDREKLHPDLLMLHAGDFLYPSLLSRRFDGAQMIDVMNVLDGDPDAFDDRLVVTFGNHELEKPQMTYAATLDARIEESAFRWLGTNLTFAAGEDGKPLVASPNLRQLEVVTSGGVSVGIFSITTAVSSPPYVASVGEPVATARESCAELRRMGAEVVVAVTHLEVDEDRALLEALGASGPDLIIGGHDHEAVQLDVGGRFVLKADADARTVTEATVTLDAEGRIRVASRLESLGERTPDAEVAARVLAWGQRFDRELCAERGVAPGCLEEPLGRTRVRLQGEEIRSRKYETNLGSWVADGMLEAFAADGAQVAFLNAGTLRLNQDIPEDAPILRRHVEELFGYPAPLRLVAIDGATLQKVVDRSIQDWSGGGWWLQIAGFAFRHDPDTGRATDLTWLGGEKQGQPILPEEKVLAVTVAFLVDPSRGQDGYKMLAPTQVVKEGPDLKELTMGRIVRAGSEGIAPRVQGRICNSRDRDAPCLARAPQGER